MNCKKVDKSWCGVGQLTPHKKGGHHMEQFPTHYTPIQKRFTTLKSYLKVLSVSIQADEGGEGIPSSAQLSIGDPMPSYLEGTRLLDFSKWGNPDQTRWGWLLLYVDKLTGQPAYAVVFDQCEGKTLKYPFSIADMAQQTLYIDNSPTDGIIDKIVKNPTHGTHEDSVGCLPNA